MIVRLRSHDVSLLHYCMVVATALTAVFVEIEFLDQLDAQSAMLLHLVAWVTHLSEGKLRPTLLVHLHAHLFDQSGWRGPTL
jgi:hypothetical protein